MNSKTGQMDSARPPCVAKYILSQWRHCHYSGLLIWSGELYIEQSFSPKYLHERTF